MTPALLEGSGVVIPTLPSGGTVTFTITATVTATSGQVTNTVTLAAPTGTTDPTPGNNTASDTDGVVAPCSISVDKTCSVGAGSPKQNCELPAAGGQVSYQYTVHNNNASPVSVNVTDDKLGAIAGPVIIAGNASQTFTHAPVSLTQSTINTATVTGNGGQCTATDKVAVTTACFMGNPATGQLYPYVDPNHPRTSTGFNESEVLAALQPNVATAGDTLRMFYVDEFAMILGVRSVNGTPYTVTPFVPTVPAGTPVAGSAGPPVMTGATEAQGGTDSAGRPMFPALFCTDITNNANAISGDWQQGGTGIGPDFVSGTWKAAVKSSGSVTSDANPASGQNATKEGACTLGPGADLPPTFAHAGSNKYCAESRWDVNTLSCNGVPLQAGHVYRVQFMVHDGDSSSDVGEACATVALP